MSAPDRSRRPRGFTLVEMATVLAIIAILSTLAYIGVRRQKPRASLATAAAELQSLLHQARQSALGSGNPVAVLFYPAYTAPAADRGSRGFVVVYQDACFDFFTGGATCGVTYATYDPAVLATGAAGTLQSAILDTMSLPYGVIVGPPTGMGAGAALAAPLAGIPVDVSCSFCDATGGAVRFDPRGQATFYRPSALAPLTPTGASVSLGFDPAATDATGQRTLVILSASGAVQAINGG